MKKQYLTVLSTLICVLGLGLGARAQEEGTVVAKVPYDFVVGGRVLPAGSYRVSRVDFPLDRESWRSAATKHAQPWSWSRLFSMTFKPGMHSLTLRISGISIFSVPLRHRSGHTP